MTHRSGDKCSCNRGVLNVYSVRHSTNTDVTVRYLKCSSCGKTAKSVVPSQFVRRHVR